MLLSGSNRRLVVGYKRGPGEDRAVIHNHDLIGVCHSLFQILQGQEVDWGLLPAGWCQMAADKATCHTRLHPKLCWTHATVLLRL